MKKIMLVLLILFAFQFFSNIHAAFAAGAIAVSDNGGKGAPVYLTVSGKGSVGEASRVVIKKCIDSGLVQCKVIVTFDKCGAYATSSTSSGAGWGITGRIARNMALRNCGDGCSIVANECDP